jgi:hypothetical protein
MTTETQIIIAGPTLSQDSMSDAQYATECALLEDCYSDLETDTDYTVFVRPCHSGEAPGTYLRQDNGQLQILGHSVEIPETLHDLSERAWQAYCSLPTDVH